MEIILRGYHDKKGKLVLADVIQIGKPELITSLYDGERDIPVSEDYTASLSGLSVRIASCKVIFPDGKKHHPVMVDKLLESIKR